MTAEQVEKKRNRSKRENMTAEQVEKKRNRDRIENMTAEQVEKKRNRSKIENKTAEQVEKNRNRSKIENMTAEQVEKKRKRDRIENMTAERVEKKRNRNRQKIENSSQGTSPLVFLYNNTGQLEMTMDENLSNGGERPPNIIIKQENEYLPCGEHAADSVTQEFVMEMDPLEPIKTEIENIHIEAGAAAIEEFTTIPSTDVHIKTEFISDEEVFDDPIDSNAAYYIQEEHQQSLETVNHQDGCISREGSKSHASSKYSKEFVATHIREGHCNKAYQCDICMDSPKTEGNYEGDHILHAKHRTRVFACHSCESTFYTKFNLKTHILHYHPDQLSEAQRYKCNLCDKDYSTKYLLQSHIKEHTGLPWKCGICGKKSPERGRLRAHIMRTHKIADKKAANLFILEISTAEDFSKDRDQIQTQVEDAQPTDEAIAAQQFNPLPQTHEYIKTELVLDEELGNGVDQSFLDQQQARVSIAEKNNETNESCQSTHQKQLFEMHRSEAHYDGIYQCDLCPRSFSDKQYLSRHRWTHNDTRPRNYMCGQCGFKFLKQSSLKSHLITHAKDRQRVSCQLCEKSFYSKHGLYLHMRLHTRETHDCEVCGLRCPLQKKLDQHVLRCHSGETPYECKLCEKSFKSATERNEHPCNPQRLRYKCEYCDKTYAYKYTLIGHMKQHTGLPWKCGICSTKFTLLPRLRSHIIRVHKITDKNVVDKHMQSVCVAEEGSECVTGDDC